MIYCDDTDTYSEYISNSAYKKYSDETAFHPYLTAHTKQSFDELIFSKFGTIHSSVAVEDGKPCAFVLYWLNSEKKHALSCRCGDMAMMTFALLTDCFHIWHNKPCPMGLLSSA